MGRHNTSKHIKYFSQNTHIIMFLGYFGLHFTPFQHISEPYQPNQYQTNQNGPDNFNYANHGTVEKQQFQR